MQIPTYIINLKSCTGGNANIKQTNGPIGMGNGKILKIPGIQFIAGDTQYLCFPICRFRSSFIYRQQTV
ncbi:hypothetical protein GGU45_004346 [Niabella hirudinis]